MGGKCVRSQARHDHRVHQEAKTQEQLFRQGGGANVGDGAECLAAKAHRPFIVK